MRGVGIVGVVALACALLPAAAWAQLSPSGIAGVVRDTSGAVLPGVTVEAASPALIEKVRTVVTDDQGQYKIVDLRIGTYVVTFSLAGFSIVRREGIELTAGFTATVNAEMRVGALEETITVTGAAPLVDTQNTRQQTVVSSQMLDVLPSGSKGLAMLVALTPGLTGLADVGGSAGTFALQNNNSGAVGGRGMHGKTGGKVMFDGMQINNLDGGGQTAGYIINSLAVEEMTVETGGVSAESNSSGIAMNMIPKEGGNTFRGSFSTLFSNDRMQSDNLTDALRARGLTTVPKFLLNRDAGGTLGGRIKQDRLWFFTAHRWWAQRYNVAGVYHNKTQGTPFYTPDLDRPSFVTQPYRSNLLRLTWQASSKDKISIFADNQDGTNPWRPENKAPESQAWMRYFPQGLYQVAWSSPRTSRLLLEAGAGVAIAHYQNALREGVAPHDIGIEELSTGFRYNAGAGLGAFPAAQGAYGKDNGDRYVQRAAVSYVTGSHAFKVGFQLQEAVKLITGYVNGDVYYRFNRGVPSAIVQHAAPDERRTRMKADLGIYVQDQWTVNRLTLNVGLRFDYLNAYVPEQHLPAGQFVPARDFQPVYDVPNWKDLNSRLNASYDLFGNGNTALKMTLGRYVTIFATNIAEANNPVVTSVNEVTRAWNDANGNYVPDCDLRIFTANGECQQVSDLNFGKPNITTRWADDVLRGFGARPYLWDFTTEVQHQLGPGVSITGGYFRTWLGNFNVTDNLAVTPADYGPYCITAPVDARLSSGGSQVCGLYDISLAKFGQVDNLISRASHFGTQSQVSDFVNLTFNTRLGSGVRFGGGIDTGRTVTDNCFVVDSPQQLLNCHVVLPWSNTLQIKLNGSYPLPRGFVVSAVIQNVGGPTILANYAAPNTQIAPSLGRNLAACGTRAVCTATAAIPLILPNSQFEGRRNQLDLRLTKVANVGSKARVQANVDLYNALNANSVLEINNNYGGQWRRPLAILSGRLIQFSGQLNF